MLVLTVGSALVTCFLAFCYYVTTFYFFSSEKFSEAAKQSPVHIHHYAPPPARRKAKPAVDKQADFMKSFVALHGAPAPAFRESYFPSAPEASTRVIPVVRGSDPLVSHKAMGALLAWADADED